MITETQAELLRGMDSEIDIKVPIQQLFDECLKFVSLADFME